MSCRACGDTGRTQGLLCLSCEGTGDYFAMCLRRAYMLGVNDGIDAMRDAMPSSLQQRTLDQIKRLSSRMQE